MRARGINYDTGIFPGGDFTRPVFTTQAVHRDMAAIAGELYCDAVRLSGRDPERLSIAAKQAADAGLEVWFGPFPVDLDPGGMLELFVDCARRAEAVRRGGAEVVFVTACEITAFCSGFLPGETYRDRVLAMATADAAWWAALGPAVQRLNDFLAETIAAVPDEDEQVRHFTELHGLFEEEGVDTSLWFTFAGFDKPAGRDLTSYGAVRMLDEIRWEPKKVFRVMADAYGRDRARD